MSGSKKISELNELTTPASEDLLVIYDADEEETKKIQAGNLTLGGFTRLPATGTVDDANQVFSFSRKPTVININGGVYPEDTGPFAWSWSAPNVTLAIPVGSGGFIEGLV